MKQVGGIKTSVVSHVWLVWDGLGGRVFGVFATRRDAAKYRRYHKGSKSGVSVVKFEVRDCEDWL